MSSFQVVAEKVAQVATLLSSYLAQAAGILVKKAEKLSLDEMSRRLDGALRALRGDDVSTSAGVITAPKTSLQRGEEIAKTYAFDKNTRVSRLTVPADVTDVEALKCLSEYLRNKHPTLNRDAVYADHLKLFENLPQERPEHCQKRDYSQARQITITAVVEGTQGQSRTTQGSVLKGKSLVFSDPRDQALAAAAHACEHNGEDLFKDLLVRGSVPGFALRTVQSRVVSVCWYDDNGELSRVAASGSPSPE